jgi:transcriptional regulator with PAS, ATPase and Fis domain
MVSGQMSDLYFHLLRREDLVRLLPLLELLGQRQPQVLSRWFDAYVRHFGAGKSLEQDTFLDLFGRDLEAVVEHLREADIEAFSEDMRGIGRELVDRRVPFAEVVASLHLFEEAAAGALEDARASGAITSDMFLTFDKLSHCRVIVLSEAYFSDRQIQTSHRISKLEREVESLPMPRTRFRSLIGQSPKMNKLYDQIVAAASGHGPVFVVGESGSGKELVAREIHESNGAAGRPFVAVNCAALTADEDYLGLIQSAANGTLFLDEITELSLEAQPKLLRVLEQRVHCRFIASTNRKPEEAVQLRALRQDLWFRLSVHQLEVPSLSDRIEDIPLLAEYFVETFSARGLSPPRGIDADALERLSQYPWPGNVRELRNAIEYALTVSRGPNLTIEDFPTRIVGRRSDPTGPRAVSTLEDAERELIQKALKATGGNKVRAARMLRISRHRLYDRLRKYSLSAE